MYRSAVNHDDAAAPGGVDLQSLLGHPDIRTFERITDLLQDIQRTAKRAMEQRYPIATGPLQIGEQVDDFGTTQTYPLDTFVFWFRSLWENLTEQPFSEGKYPVGIENKGDVAPVIRALTLCLHKQGTAKTFDQIYYAVKRCRQEDFTYV